MTVCVAAIFAWNYADKDSPPEFGPAIICASDRMLTDEGLGIQYEPHQRKSAFLGDRVVAMVAGDVTVHTDVLRRLIAKLKAHPEGDPAIVASMYAQLVRELISRRASHKYLAPFGLDMASFMKSQKSMDPNLVMELSNKIINEEIDASALVVGCTDEKTHISSIDSKGIVRGHDDIGFASIGIGSIHASGQFLMNSYTNRWRYYDAMSLAYSAKKRAEFAPGIGRHTDMYVVNRRGWFAIDSETLKKMDELYEQDNKARMQLDSEFVKKVHDYDQAVITRRKAKEALEAGADVAPKASEG